MNAKLSQPLLLLAFSLLAAIIFAVRYDECARMPMESIAVFVAGGIAVIKSFRNRYYLISLLPVLLIVFYASGGMNRAIHGGLAFSSRYCDMGVCYHLDIMNDGDFIYTYYYQAYPEEGSHRRNGKSVIAGNQILLYTVARPPQNNFRQQLGRLKAEHPVTAKAADFPMGEVTF